MVLKIFALVVILVIVATVIWLAVVVGSMPGKIAREKEHPQAEAIAVLGWIGLITLGLGWFAAMVWAHCKPLASMQQIADLQQRIERIERGQAMPEPGEANT